MPVLRFLQFALLAVTLPALVLAGCAGGSSSGPGGGGGTAVVSSPTGTVMVIHSPPRAEVRTTPVPPEVDTLEFRGFDAAGNLAYGWTRRGWASTIVLDDVPRSVRTLHIDYLRNAGLALRTVDVPVDLGSGMVRVVDPPHSPAPTPTSTWSVTSSGTPGTGSASWTLNVAVGSPSPSPSPSPFRIKGVCYSPAPINSSNKSGPNIGDYFFDNVTDPDDPSIVYFYNWFGLWGPADAQLGNSGYYARGDLDDLRTNLGANAIRVYGMISRQLNSDTMNPDGSFKPQPAGYHFTHQEFLDQCWNNGNDPLYVLVGIPMSAACFDMNVTPATGEVAFWEAVLQETVSDVGSHPAVLGFTVMNELDQVPAAFPPAPSPSPSPSPSTYATADTNYFYGQAMKYAQTVKAAAPGKLVGWAVHDSNELVGFASTQTPDTSDPDYSTYGFTAGQPYFAQLTDFDYWGVNTYQTQTLASLLDSGYAHPSPDPYDSSGSYGAVTGLGAKPLILTEMGWPATGHDPVNTAGPSPNAELYYLDASPSPSPSALPPTGPPTANTITTMYGQAYASSIVLGAFYFEYADEWWAQNTDPGDQDFQWDAAGQAGYAPQFPNGWWDQEGFGLYSTARAGGRANTAPNNDSSGPILPMDAYTRRPAVFDALKAVFAAN